MGQNVTLGGKRLGSGSQVQEKLPNFGRSNHNLDSGRFTTMSPGILYPFYTIPCTADDKFDMDISAFMRTVPTVGPLYGSFKLQVDFFFVPIRLYQAVLHNNPTRMGLKMNQVKLPKILFEHKWDRDEIQTHVDNDSFWNSQTAPNSLLRYCGVAGAGRGMDIGQTFEAYMLKRKFTAVPILGYYDIFKNYYANKQEEYAYVITPLQTPQTDVAQVYQIMLADGMSGTMSKSESAKYYEFQSVGIATDSTITLSLTGDAITSNMSTIEIFGADGNWYNLEEIDNGDTNLLSIVSGSLFETSVSIEYYNASTENVNNIRVRVRKPSVNYSSGIELVKFELSNIDDMRMELLSQNQLGTEYVINDFEKYPYLAVCGTDQKDHSKNSYPLNGLCVKTYQSDMFNNWLDTEYIDGENGINAITAVNTESGSFTIDALTLANKVYKMLNRIAISGGTYQDWLEAVYSDNVIQQNEIPVYLGGMSSEVVFDEVISTAASGNEELGSLAGRGNLADKSRKGGHITYEPRELGFIMGIASLTPRICYSQGNAFYMDFDTADDFHKPSLDGIGFQDLLVERMAFNGTQIYPNGVIQQRLSAGKQTAYIDWQTDVDRCYGDFALEQGRSYMVLNRDFGVHENTARPTDITTYIDPKKYNYIFADSNLEAQNFWAFIKVENKARRLMSASQIPNL